MTAPLLLVFAWELRELKKDMLGYGLSHIRFDQADGYADYFFNHVSLRQHGEKTCNVAQWKIYL